MADQERIALVSGANRGIGLEVSRQLGSRGLRVLMGSRELKKGEAAAEELRRDGLEVEARQLDVSDPESIDRLASEVRSDPGRLDVLVNNAGISGDRGQRGEDADLDEIKRVLETNLFGAWRLCEAFIPLMRENGYGRIVNVSSGMGGLTEMNGYVPGYRLSKTGLNVLTRILSNELSGSGILVNSACPGWVRTDMGGSTARVSVEDGADTLVWLATLPDDGPTGGFFRNREPIPW